MLSLLAQCSIHMLDILYESVQSGEITNDEFREHSQIKVTFLENSLGQIESEEDKTKILRTLEKCSWVNSSGSSVTINGRNSLPELL